MEPIRYLARVVEALNFELSGDVGYSGTLTKNPWHPRWRVLVWGGEPVGLDDLYAAVCCAPTRPFTRQRAEVRSGIGRNVELFDRLRFWAYDHKHQYTDRRTWALAVAAQAMGFNGDFVEPMAVNEVGWIIKSVAGWVWTRYSPEIGLGRVNRGAMELSQELPLGQKQALAGTWSATKRRSHTDSRITEAVAAMLNDGHAITQASVSAASGLGLATIKRRWPMISAMTKSVSCGPVTTPVVEVEKPTMPSPPVPSRPDLSIVGAARGISGPSTPKSRAGSYRQAQLAAMAAQIEAERTATGGHPPVPAYAVAAQRMRAIK